MKDFKDIKVLNLKAGKVIQYELPEIQPLRDIGDENNVTNAGKH